MSEDITQLRIHAQRSMAAAHQVDHRLESAASARLIVAARVFLSAVDVVVESQRPRVVAVEAAIVPEAPRPLSVGEVVLYRVRDKFYRRATIRSEHLHHGEREFTLEWAHGTVTALASECVRA